jgi:hypothetical protein
MGFIIPPKAPGMSADEYLEILTDAYNQNPINRIMGRKLTVEQAKKMAKPKKEKPGIIEKHF